MSKIYLIAIIIIAASASVYADQIYLKSNKIIKGKVIQITDTKVEYDPEGEIPFDVIAKSEVVKIVYESNSSKTVVVMNKEASKKPEDSKTNNEKKDIESQNDNKKENQDGNISRNFRLGFVIGGGAWGGYLVDKEQALCDEYEGAASRDIGAGELFLAGLDLDLMVYPVASDVKWGIKGRFLSVSDDQEEADGKVDELFSFKTWQIGPVLNTIIDEDERGILGIQYYALYGRITNGKFDAMNYLRGDGLVVDRSEYHTTFKGYTVSFGIGPYLQFKGVPLFLGLNLNYTYAKFQFDKELPAYKSDHTSFDSVSIEFIGGIAF